MHIASDLEVTMDGRILTGWIGLFAAVGATSCLADGSDVAVREAAVVEANEACGAGCGMVPSPIPEETWYPTYEACKAQACERPAAVFCSPAEGGWVGSCGTCQGSCPDPWHLCMGPFAGDPGEADVCACEFFK